MTNDPQDDDGKQVSEAGSSFSDTETDQGGADAVPDKSTGSATGDDTSADLPKD